MPDSDHDLVRRIARATRAKEVELGERIQSLWSGYGEIRRVQLFDATVSSAILKSIAPPDGPPLARDPAKRRSHRRKLKSYAVELSFYREHAARARAAARLPELYWAETHAERSYLLLEDLDLAGYAERRSRCGEAEVAQCLRWLAAFHAAFLGSDATSLWKVGTYWHLATRPDELQALGAHPLRAAAARIDQRLSAARFRTLVHGDAKLENFCFGSAGVAAVDFQYVGGGVGIKDVAYFLNGCFTPRECARAVPRCLDLYFDELRARLPPDVDGAALESEWRALFPLAWVDFFRFLLGWAPAYAAGDDYSEALARDVVART